MNRRHHGVCECGAHAFTGVSKGRVMLADAEDISLVRRWNWTLHNRFYAKRGTSTGDSIAFHREVIGAANGLQVDHINGNGLDNRKANLREVDKAQNQMNRHAVVSKSAFKGVTANKKAWAATISKREHGIRRRLYLGTFPTKEEAAAAYDAAARSLFGEHARTNFQEYP